MQQGHIHALVDQEGGDDVAEGLLDLVARAPLEGPLGRLGQLLPMVSQLEQLLNAGDRAGALKLLQGSILPFLSAYTSKTNDMGLSRTLISMLALKGHFPVPLHREQHMVQRHVNALIYQESGDNIPERLLYLVARTVLEGVQQMIRPLTISGVFPRIFEGENSINVKI